MKFQVSWWWQRALTLDLWIKISSIQKLNTSPYGALLCTIHGGQDWAERVEAYCLDGGAVVKEEKKIAKNCHVLEINQGKFMNDVAKSLKNF